VNTIGTIDDVIIAFVNPASGQRDTLTIGSDTWYAAAPSSNATILFRGI
jgi:hypothetical protein